MIDFDTRDTHTLKIKPTKPKVVVTLPASADAATIEQGIDDIHNIAEVKAMLKVLSRKIHK